MKLQLIKNLSKLHKNKSPTKQEAKNDKKAIVKGNIELYTILRDYKG
jgi:hypothetical protein